jgi:hypothetical protein
MRTGEPRSRTLATDYGFTENIGNLGKSRQLLIPKAWHIHGNMGLDHGTGHLASMNSQKNQHINDGKG